MISNASKGQVFQHRVRHALELHFGEPFDTEVTIDIGSPPVAHRFDLASRSRGRVCECKAFTWTMSGNTPSAKITTLREAAQFLNLLPRGTERLVKRDIHSCTLESLGQYFVRLNTHLLESVVVLELEDDTGTLVPLRGRSA